MATGCFSAFQQGISNDFFHGTGSNACGRLVQFCMVVLSWVLTIAHTLFPALEHCICCVKHNRWVLLLLWTEKRVQPPLPCQSVKPVNSGLEVSLPSPCKDLRQGCCSDCVSTQNHTSISHWYAWILLPRELLLQHGNLLEKFVQWGTPASMTPASAFRR